MYVASETDEEGGSPDAEAGIPAQGLSDLASID